jgi:transposase
VRWPVGEAVFAFSPHVRVYLASQPVDMRAGHDGLFAIVKSWDLNPFSGDLFAFVGKRGDRAKILVWQETRKPPR